MWMSRRSALDVRVRKNTRGSDFCEFMGRGCSWCAVVLGWAGSSMLWAGGMRCWVVTHAVVRMLLLRMVQLQCNAGAGRAGRGYGGGRRRKLVGCQASTDSLPNQTGELLREMSTPCLLRRERENCGGRGDARELSRAEFFKSLRNGWSHRKNQRCGTGSIGGWATVGTGGRASASTACTRQCGPKMDDCTSRCFG